MTSAAGGARMQRDGGSMPRMKHAIPAPHDTAPLGATV